MSTIENNKLIAEFMGYTFEFLSWRNPEGQDVELFRLYSNGECRGTEEVKLYWEYFMTERLKYQKDWNALMEVVEKIEEGDWIVEIAINHCKIWNTEAEYPDILSEGHKDRSLKKIDVVYQAVIQFIQFYNENKPTR